VETFGVVVIGAGPGGYPAAIRAELTATELAQTIHSHPTLAEAWMEAANVLLGEPIHTIAKRPR
jgi:dihydrolipoamide dehydrogenase